MIPSFTGRLDAGGAGTGTHDLGFLYTLSCVAAWRLTGSVAARQVAIRAAEALTIRYWPDARIVQAWRSLDDPDERGRVIIDGAMNMPLLFFAAEETGRRQHRDIAVNHLDQCARLLVRPNGSTAHTCYVDVETGEPLRVRRIRVSPTNRAGPADRRGPCTDSPSRIATRARSDSAKRRAR